MKYFESKKDDRNFDFIHTQHKKIEMLLEKLKEDIDYKTFINSKEFFDYKKESVAYKAMTDFYSEK